MNTTAGDYVPRLERHRDVRRLPCLGGVVTVYTGIESGGRFTHCRVRDCGWSLFSDDHAGIDVLAEAHVSEHDSHAVPS